MRRFDFKILKRLEWTIALFTLFPFFWTLFSMAVNRGFGIPLLPVYPPLGSMFYLVFKGMVGRIFIWADILFVILVTIPMITPLFKKGPLNFILFWTDYILNVASGIVLLVSGFGFNRATYAVLFNLICFAVMGFYIINKIKKIQLTGEDLVLEYEINETPLAKKIKLAVGKLIRRALYIFIICFFWLLPVLIINMDDEESPFSIRKKYLSDLNRKVAVMETDIADSEIGYRFKGRTIECAESTEVGEGPESISPGHYAFVSEESWDVLYIDHSISISGKYVHLIDLKKGQWAQSRGGVLIPYDDEFRDQQMDFGIYEAGKDIEPGSYELRALYKNRTGDYCIYSNPHTLKVVEEGQVEESQTVTLKEGQILSGNNLAILNLE